MSCAAVLAAVVVFAAPLSAEIVVVLDHKEPTAIYDNLGGGNTLPVAGQTFIATADNFAGVSVWIGDSLSTTGPLAGSADLVLFDAQDLSLPVELARARVVETGEEVSGEVDLLLGQPVATQPGRKYFFAISTADSYGLGLHSAHFSTYPDGAESFLLDGAVQEHEFGRDASFAIYGDTAFDADVGATVTGITPRKVKCRNRTTGQDVAFVTSETSFNCEAAGLIVNPGDVIVIRVRGKAEG